MLNFTVVMIRLIPSIYVKIQFNYIKGTVLARMPDYTPIKIYAYNKIIYKVRLFGLMTISTLDGYLMPNPLYECILYMIFKWIICK